MRNLVHILREIKKQIPEDLDRREEMLGILQSIATSTVYTAPEAMSHRWKQASEVLCTYLGEPDTDWKRNIQGIFSGDIK